MRTACEGAVTVATDPKPRGENEAPTRPSKPADPQAPIESTAADSTGTLNPRRDGSPANDGVDPSGLVEVLRRRLLKLLDDHDET